MSDEYLPNFAPEEPNNQISLKPVTKPFLAVTGHGDLSEFEQQIIDHPTFQRMRRLKQLGTSYLVFPSATHTRFEHSLGVHFRVVEMIKAIRENQYSSEHEKRITPEEEMFARLLALLHDVANLPFGHTLEDETKVVNEYQEDQERFLRVLKPEEKGSLGYLLISRLGQQRFDKLFSFLTSSEVTIHLLGEEAFIVDLVKNTLCADLLDYLARDAYMTGITLEVGNEFLRYLYLDEMTSGSGHVVRRPVVRAWKDKTQSHRVDVVSELAKLLDNRFSLSQIVYYHHAKIASGAMLGRAVLEALENPKQGRSLTIDAMLEMGDEELLSFLKTNGNTVSSRLAELIVNRRLYKRLWKFSYNQSEPGQWAPKEELPKRYRDPLKRRKFEDELASRVGLESGDVLIYCPPKNMSMKAARMLVLWKGSPRPLEEIDDKATKLRIDSILESHQSLWAFRVYVAPHATEEQKEKLRAWCEEFRTGEVPMQAVKDEVIVLASERGLPADRIKVAMSELTDTLVKSRGTRPYEGTYDLLKIVKRTVDKLKE